MIKIENDKYQVEINEIGAELTHFVLKNVDYDLIWNDPDGSIWKRHAPILFPAIGRSNNGKYILNNKYYNMKQHGFARDYQFNEIKKYGNNRVELIQHATSDTMEVFPFDYVLHVMYELVNQGLKINFTVENPNQTIMPFALGFHPGWNIRGFLEEYSIELKGSDTPISVYGVGPVPFRNGTIFPLDKANFFEIPLSRNLLDKGLVILDVHNVNSILLKRKPNTKILKINLKDFPYLTLWSPEGKNAPFVCIEPFAGLPDEAGKTSNWYQKLGNILLDPGESKSFATLIEPFKIM